MDSTGDPRAVHRSARGNPAITWALLLGAGRVVAGNALVAAGVVREVIEFPVRELTALLAPADDLTAWLDERWGSDCPPAS